MKIKFLLLLFMLVSVGCSQPDPSVKILSPFHQRGDYIFVPELFLSFAESKTGRYQVFVIKEGVKSVKSEIRLTDEDLKDGAPMFCSAWRDDAYFFWNIMLKEEVHVPEVVHLKNVEKLSPRIVRDFSSDVVCVVMLHNLTKIHQELVFNGVWNDIELMKSVSKDQDVVFLGLSVNFD